MSVGKNGLFDTTNQGSSYEQELARRNQEIQTLKNQIETLQLAVRNANDELCKNQNRINFLSQKVKPYPSDLTSITVCERANTKIKAALKNSNAQQKITAYYNELKIKIQARNQFECDHITQTNCGY